MFGLTASGKSSLAKALGERFGLRVVHPSGIMRNLMEGGAADASRTRANDGYWETPEGARRLSERTAHEVPVDVATTQVLLQEVDRGEVVIDTWSLPWLTPYGFKVHLKASPEVRVRRAAARAQSPEEVVRQRVESKDRQTQELFKRLYGFDIFTDFEDRFHLTVETDGLSAKLVEERTSAAFDRYCQTLTR